ncbi:copper resistance protein NlpE [Haliscomenobacter sp.]|uniref:copper resistance protein NlpE n=1 Tax=Haliscomenobacter sp. TaxID=2717303 RepID=UPI0035941909
MKKLIFVCFSMIVLFSCQEKTKKTLDTTDSSAIANEEAMVNQLAAFYNGTVPCPDCDEIVTMLTLNADEKRTFTLEEEYKGKESRTVESTGTWTADGDVVTLNQKSGISKYQVTDDGLVSLNADGSKRDSESAKKYLLKKVLGE